MGNRFLNLGERIEYLMLYKDIHKAPELARALYDTGIMAYKSENSDKEEAIQYTTRAINMHLKYKDGSQLSGVWLKRYCDFFGCSSDFLLGYIDLPKHDIHGVNMETGLSHSAVNKLKSHNFEGSNLASIVSTIISSPEIDYISAICNEDGSNDDKQITFSIGGSVSSVYQSTLKLQLLDDNFNEIAKRLL